MNQNLQTQVVIVGAGPAGAATSIYLSQAGIHHIILEKDRFPRDKVCGDACSGKTAFVLRKANPSWMQEIFQHEEQYLPSRGIIFVAPNGKQLSIPFGSAIHAGETAPGFTSPRMVFDQFLFDKIASPYATVYQNAQVESLQRVEGGGINVQFTCAGQTHSVNSPLLVGADGDKSVVRKTFLTDKNLPKAYAVGLRAYYKGVSGMNQENYVELHFLRDILPGYLWIFPLPNGMANVGIGILSEVIRDKKINLRERMLSIIQTHPAIKDRFAGALLEGKIQGWGLPMCMEKLPVSGDHFLLTGDAASLVDPFSGEGIGNALYSGMLAAFAIRESITANRFDRSFLQSQYDAVLYKRIGDELKISATLQRLCNYPWLFNFVVNKAHKSPSLNKTISCMFTDMDLRAQFSKPSFYLKMLFNR
ncbi:MAG: geranylgeranyl reductase family protein [Williamsia sp.]|nr:geranylgeranyl reductase family protein [Williamsia sp.]